MLYYSTILPKDQEEDCMIYKIFHLQVENPGLGLGLFLFFNPKETGYKSLFRRYQANVCEYLLMSG